MLWVEDPIAPENLEGFRRIRDALQRAAGRGERQATIFGERELIERELVDVIQPDTGRAGGITQMKKIAAMAEAHHIMMAPHSGSLGPVAEYAALHVLAAIPNGLILERIEDDWDGRAQDRRAASRAEGRLPRRAGRAGSRRRHRRGFRRAVPERGATSRSRSRKRPAATPRHLRRARLRPDAAGAAYFR